MFQQDEEFHYYEGRLTITVKEAFLLRSADLNGLSDPYCVVSIYSNKKYTKVKTRTHTIDCTLNPVWESTHEFDITGENIMLYLEVFDYDLLSADDLLGTCRFEVPKTGGTTQVYRKLLTRQGKPCMGAIIFDVTWHPKGFVVSEEDQIDVSVNLKKYEGCGYINVKLLEAQDLKPEDISKSCDTLAIIKSIPQNDRDPCERQTKVLGNTIAPVWDEILRIPTDFKSYEDLREINIEVYREEVPENELLGSCTVTVPAFQQRLKAIKSLGNHGILICEVWFESLGARNANHSGIPGPYTEHKDRDADVNLFVLRERVGDAYAVLRKVQTRAEKAEAEEANQRKQNQVLSSEFQKAMKEKLMLERRLEAALVRNDNLRHELRHADEIYNDNVYSSLPQIKKRPTALECLEASAAPEEPPGYAHPGSPFLKTMELFGGSVPDAEAPNHGALWLLFNRLTESWAPKVRNERFCTLLEGAMEPKRVREVNRIFRSHGEFLTFDEITFAMQTLKVTPKEWKVFVKAVRNNSFK